jgi:diguanylate cyclase (GGDEF)-like protein
MSLQLTLVGLLGIVGVSALAVLAQVWHRGQVLRHPALSAILVASALYAFGYAVEIAGGSVAWVLATYRVQYLAIAAAPTLLLWLAAGYAGHGWLRRPTWRYVAVAVSVATYLVVATNPAHALYHVAPRMDLSGPFPLIAFERGPWYLGFQMYSAVAVLVANTVFLRAWRVAREPRRTQVLLLFVASVLPWLGNLANLADALPLGIDVMPFTLLATSVVLYRGVVRQGLADLAPIARSLVFERMGDAVLVLDPVGHVLDQNEAAVKLLGRITEGRTADPSLARWHPELAAAIAAMAEEPDTGSLRIDVTLRDEPSEVVLRGRTYGVRLVELRSCTRRHLGRIVVLRDVTRAVEMAEQLRALATTDELTGIPNRRHFVALAGRELERAGRSGRPITLIVFDLDRFKQVNDRHGHQAGDDVLRAVAAAVAAGVRAVDVVGRYGGEEFAVCLPDADEATAAAVAERVRAAVAALRVPVPGGTVRVSASVGSATALGPDLPDLDGLLARADQAQYDAKALGGDRVVAHAPQRGAPAAGAVPGPAQAAG